MRSGEYLSADKVDSNGPERNFLFSHTVYQFANGEVSLLRVLNGAIFKHQGEYGHALRSNARKGQKLLGYGDSVAILGRGDRVPILINAKYTKVADKIVIDWKTGKNTNFTADFGDYEISRVGQEETLLYEGGKLISKTFPGTSFEYFGDTQVSGESNDQEESESLIILKAAAEAVWAKSSGKRAGEEKIIEISPGVSMTFCWCPAGKYTMGSPESEADRTDEEDQVEVTISQGFWMAKTEVTQAQWQAVMGDNPSHFKGANRPVEQVSWDDAQEFLTKINSIVGNSDGGKMALPTEAQWEYAARAGETGPYSGGMLDEVAWYSDNSERETHLVGTKKPNAWGLHDMHGNVWERCEDWYDDTLPGGVDPSGPSSGTYRVIRGGSWFSIAFNCRAAGRGNFDPGYSYGLIGFRLARSSVP